MIFKNSSSLINGSNFIATILSSNNIEPKDQLNMGISSIDLGNCTQIIKGHYNSINNNKIISDFQNKKNEYKKSKISKR